MNICGPLSLTGLMGWDVLIMLTKSIRTEGNEESLQETEFDRILEDAYTTTQN